MKVIRMATPKDTDSILDIYTPFIQNTATSFELEVPTIEKFSNRIATYLSESPWLVCEESHQVIGYAYASPHRGRAAYQWNREVSAYVHPKYHRKGIARQLYSALFQLLLLQGFTNVLAGIVLPNTASERFHQSMGFSKIGTYRNIGFKLNAWRDVSWYEKLLYPVLPDTPSKLLSMDQLTISKDYPIILQRFNEQLNGKN